MDNISLDAIFYKQCTAHPFTGDITKDEVIDAMKEAIHQALILVSKKAKVEKISGLENVSLKTTHKTDDGDFYSINKQSILNIEELIV